MIMISCTTMLHRAAGCLAKPLSGLELNRTVWRHSSSFAGLGLHLGLVVGGDGIDGGGCCWGWHRWGTDGWNDIMHTCASMPLQELLRQQGKTEPSDVQLQAIPVILGHKSCAVQSCTGSGKVRPGWPSFGHARQPEKICTPTPGLPFACRP